MVIIWERITKLQKKMFHLLISANNNFLVSPNWNRKLKCFSSKKHQKFINTIPNIDETNCNIYKLMNIICTNELILPAGTFEIIDTNKHNINKF